MENVLKDVEKMAIVEAAWRSAPTLKKFRKEDAKPQRIKKRVFLTIIEMVGAGAGIIRLIKLDAPRRTKKHYLQVICLEIGKESRVFSCLTKKSVALEYRFILWTGRVHTSLP